MNISGYLVFPKSDSNTSSCALVKVVLSRRCFLVFTPGSKEREKFMLKKYYLEKRSWLEKISLHSCIHAKPSSET